MCVIGQTRFELNKIVLGHERYENVTLMLNETTRSLQPFLGQAKIGHNNGAFAIQFDLVHSMQMTLKAKRIRIRFFLDRELKLEMNTFNHNFNFDDGEQLVNILKSFTGKVCQLVGQYMSLLDEPSRLIDTLRFHRYLMRTTNLMDEQDCWAGVMAVVYAARTGMKG